MKLEKQICSLEHAKKLKELGAKQESEWIWAIMNIGAGQSAYIYNTVGDKGYHRDVEYSAYTVAELGELLPFKIYSNPIPNPFELKINKLENKWEVYYLAYESRELNNTDLCPTINANTEANARASMLIYLLENNLTKQEG